MLGKGKSDNFIINNYKDLNFQDNYLNIQNKDLTQDNYLIKQKEVIENQPLTKNINNKSYTDADSLVEFFHGMMLNHISLRKDEFSKDKSKLENIITKYNKNKKKNLKGGYDYLFADDNTIEIDYDIESIKLIDIIYHIEENVYDRRNGTHYIQITCKNENDDSISSINIDFNSGFIYDALNSTKIYYSCSSENINNIITHIIDKLIEKENNNDIECNYDINGIQLDEKDKQIIHGSIIPLLILILTIRKNCDKSVYSYYYYKYFLNDAIINFNSKEKFTLNNKNVLLTYSNNNINPRGIKYNGDCVINVNVCCKEENLKRAIIDKLKLIETPVDIDRKDFICSRYDIINYNNYCVNTINYIINEMNNDIINEMNNDNLFENYKNNIIQNVQSFTTFIIKIQDIDNIFKKCNSININDVTYDKNNNTFNNIWIQVLYDLCNLLIKHSTSLLNVIFDFNCVDFIDYYINQESNDIEDIKNMQKILNDINQLKHYPKVIQSTYISSLSTVTDIFNKYLKIIQCIDMRVYYINILISLYLMLYKVRYVFDELIINTLNIMPNKNLIIRRFLNMSNNDNNIDGKIFNYYNYNNTEDYLFSEMIIPKHAILSIIKLENNINDININKKHYIIDLNYLNFIVIANGNTIYTTPSNIKSFNIKTNEYDENTQEYYFGRKRFGTQEYKLILSLIYKNNFIDSDIDIDEVKKYNMEYIIETANNLGLCNFNYEFYNNYHCHFVSNRIHDNLKYHIREYFNNNKLCYVNDKILLDINEYTYNNYINILYDLNINLKKFILKDLLNALIKAKKNLLSNWSIDINKKNKKNKYLDDYNSLYDNIKIMYDYEYYTLDNLLYVFVNYIYSFIYYHYNLINSGIKFCDMIQNVFESYTYVNFIKIDSYLQNNDFFEAEDINKYIIIVICTFDYNNYDYSGNIINGGNNIKNSIIKKILIIFLVIVIIIIVVLIVLYIINKYKNKNNLK